MNGVHISLGGLGGLGVALLALALASEHFGDWFLYLICLTAGIISIASAITTRLYDWWWVKKER